MHLTLKCSVLSEPTNDRKRGGGKAGEERQGMNEKVLPLPLNCFFPLCLHFLYFQYLVFFSFLKFKVQILCVCVCVWHVAGPQVAQASLERSMQPKTT